MASIFGRTIEWPAKRSRLIFRGRRFGGHRPPLRGRDAKFFQYACNLEGQYQFRSGQHPDRSLSGDEKRGIKVSTPSGERFEPGELQAGRGKGRPRSSVGRNRE